MVVLVVADVALVVRGASLGLGRVHAEGQRCAFAAKGAEVPEGTSTAARSRGGTEKRPEETEHCFVLDRRSRRRTG